ncbi:MAG: polysaccharide deacetylase family protein, partial [Candidatus Andersenbacteria bacterium]
ALSSETQSQSGVHIVGALSQERLAMLYRVADLFALPAQGELFTLAMQEAMASGLPVLTTNEPEYGESDLDTTLVSLTFPDAQEIKSELKRLFSHPELRKRMRSYALHYARTHFDWNKNVQELLSLYTPLQKQKDVTVTTSWDDGHLLDLKLAALLKKYGIAGTFYISPKDKEIPPEKRLTDSQILSLSKDFEVGAHTMTHPRLTETGDAVAQEEIEASKSYLEQVLGRPVTSFCYPAGYYEQKHIAFVKKAGFRLGRTVRRFAFSVGDDPFVMPTTVHAYRHWSDLLPIVRAVGIRKFMRCYLNWDMLTIELFENARRNGGVFHLWGHSWEIDNHGDWERLERVLQHISAATSVRYCTNSELV